MAMDWGDPQEVAKRRQQAIEAGYKPADVDTFIKQKRTESAQMQLSQQGVLDVGELAKSNPQAALQAIQQGAKPKAEAGGGTESERTKRKLATSGLKSLADVDKFYKKDPNILAKQLIPGKLASRSFDSALFGAVDTLLRIRTGATAPEEEIRRYMDAYGPKVGDSPEDVSFKMNQLKTALASEGGISEEEVEKLLPQQSSAFQRGQENTQQSQRPSLQGVLGQLLGGQPAPQIQAPNIDPGKMVMDILKGQVANQISPNNPLLGNADPVSNKITELMMPNFTKSRQALGQGQLPTGDEAKGAGIETLLSLVGAGGLGAVNKGVNAVKGAVSLKEIGKKSAVARQAAKDVPFSGDDFAQPLKEYIKDDPLAERVANKIIPTIEGKSFTLEELLKKKDIWDTAYNVNKRAGKSEKAAVYNVLASKARELIAQKAPEVSKINKQFSKAYDMKKTGPSLVRTAAGMAGLGVGGELLNRLIFGER